MGLQEDLQKAVSVLNQIALCRSVLVIPSQSIRTYEPYLYSSGQQTPTMDDKVTAVLEVAQFVPLLLSDVSTPNRIQLLSESLQLLRQSCSYGPAVRFALASSADLTTSLHELLTLQDSEYCQPAKFGWQMLVNCCYKNAPGQRLIWTAYRPTMLAVLAEPANAHAELCRMLVYTLLVHDIVDADGAKAVLRLLVAQYSDACEHKSETLPEHLQFCLEYFGCRRRGILPLYGSLTDEERVAFLQFIGDYLRGSADDVGRTQPLSSELVPYLCKEFKKKSDCVLKTEASYAEAVHPREVYALLAVISALSGDVVHAPLLSADSSLFLNVGCLLAAIGTLGQKSENVFTPVAKLGQIAPNSSESTAIERDISYDLKTMLVRTIANLAHRNARNQELAREMDILLAVLNCTSVDARNPLIKEWSVLAIRNLCEGCAENQAIVRGLMKVGDVDNSAVLKEFDMDMGSMRIAGSPE